MPSTHCPIWTLRAFISGGSPNEPARHSSTSPSTGSSLEADVLVNTYDARSSRRLAASIVAGAGSPLGAGGPPAGARVIEAGGGWHLSTWRENLRRLVDRRAVSGLALRTSRVERQLPATDWAQVTGTMANEIGLA